MKLFLYMSLLLALLLSTMVIAQESNQVALVISLGDGEVLTRCVEFSEDQISGYDALSRAGLELQTEIVGLGATVCSIEESGCPAGDCFCQCKGGGPCIYWSYWHLDGGQWSYSPIGAGSYQLSDGDVDGWVWDLGSPNDAPPPPAISFEDVCAPGSPASVVDEASTLNPQQEQIATAVVISPEESEVIPMPDATGLAAFSTDGVPSTEGVVPSVEDGVIEPQSGIGVIDSGSQWFLYALFALIVTGIAATLAVSLRGKRNA